MSRDWPEATAARPTLASTHGVVFLATLVIAFVARSDDSLNWSARHWHTDLRAQAPVPAISSVQCTNLMLSDLAQPERMFYSLG